MNKQLGSLYYLAMKDMNNDVLAFANMGLSGFGCIGNKNGAFETLRKAELIQDNGKPEDAETMLDVLSILINERIEAGTFN